ncbi:hypothetical protein AGDE_12924 [Angomonas deanei]|uniref:Uncharacterized protein n=1 Tax=Angomonas deanei TaxID=59799 RepID=A0A7G2CH11_9TRYP|nr:hypothetical protein AGDE_12924 [Angomonas deanei]CAD2218779.1 hypothetical protein, conserved [Angomonas deanei]|eukprot:EPY23247.1 hypothetical protein AGDE_12924 [Angomonas deanei]
MLDTVRREWKEAHTEVWEAKKLEDGLTQSLLEELQAQEGMHVQLQEVKVAVAEEETARAMALRQTTSSGSPYRRRCRPCTKLFLPSGPVDPTDTTTPASHNARAMLATITRRNYQRPREYLQRHGLAVRYEECSPTRVTREAPKTVPSLVPPAAPSPATALHRASRMLLEELAELRESYYRYKTMLTDPRHGNTVEISQQIRECLNKLDKKAEQVRQLHREETKYGYRAHSVPDVLREIVRENKYCEAVYTDLLVLLRGQ